MTVTADETKQIDLYQMRKELITWLNEVGDVNSFTAEQMNKVKLLNNSLHVVNALIQAQKMQQ